MDMCAQRGRLELRAGEVLAVTGDNGAGKSSLIKCLSGAITPDEGQIWLDGRPVQFHCPNGRARGRNRDGVSGAGGGPRQ